MNLNCLISAANWLYENAPAQYISEDNCAILVCGDGELADALFDLMFTTAFRPSITIRLVRVVSDAGACKDRFIGRNAQRLAYFEKKPADGDKPRRSIVFRFMDEASDWRSVRYACAFAPEGVDVDPRARIVRLNDIPVLRSAGETWSAADEATVPVLRIARRVHTAYTLGWNDRYREEDVDRALYGPPDAYMLRSSLRLAVSIPWKMAIAGARDAKALHEKISDTQTLLFGHSMKDYLAWQEHRSWQAFMTLDGWSAPGEEELAGYLFRDGNDHRNKAHVDREGRRNPLHPCLCDLEEDDWFVPRTRTLRQTRHSDWSAAYSQARDEFSSLDRISLIIHHRCKEIVVSEAYGCCMEERFNQLEDALICAHLARADVLFQRLRLIENLFQRLRNNEPNSCHPFEQACRSFVQGLSESAGDDIDRVRQAFDRMADMAGVAVERNKYCDYKEIDARIIEWLPWIIHDASIDVVWKLYTRSDLFENILSSIMLRPKKLVLVYTGASICEEQMETYREILARHGLEHIDVRAVPISQFSLDALDAREQDRQVVDVSGAGDLQHSVAIPGRVGVVYYENGKLHDKVGSPVRATYYSGYIPITIDEMLRMKGQKQLSIEQNNDMLGMEAEYEALWDFARAQGGAGNWHRAIETLKKAEASVCHRIYRDTGRGSAFYRKALTEDMYRALIRNGGVRALYDLQKRKAISGLVIDAAGNGVIMNLFPAATTQQGDPYSQSRGTIEYILSQSADSELVVDDEYARTNDPILVCDMNTPLKISGADGGILSGFVRNGMLIRSEKGYRFKSAQTRCGLRKQGSALEAYVYYTLFLSGRFDDVRVNVRMQTGVSANGMALEKEVDVLVTKNGAMGLISCKDTAAVDLFHIVELANQAREYGTIVKPMLVCSKDADLDDRVRAACGMLQVGIIGIAALTGNERSRRALINEVLRKIS